MGHVAIIVIDKKELVKPAGPFDSAQNFAELCKVRFVSCGSRLEKMGGR
jgi:hypothetical protein